MAKHDKKRKRATSQNVEQHSAPIYQALQPDWNDTETLHRPLMARGDFSNAWVLYDQDELPAEVERPTAMIDTRQRHRNGKQKKE